MGKKESRKFKNSPLGTILIVFFCIVVNFVGKHLAVKYELPLWLDSVGTVFAAYVLGPVCGAIIGGTGNIIYSFWDANSLAYCLTSIFIGASMGTAARKKYFESFFGATTVAGGVTIGSVFISTILNLSFYGGYTGNVWGDGVVNFLMDRNIPRFIASTIGEMYLDFLDKIITVLFMFYLIKVVRFFRKNEIKKPPLITGLLIIALVLGSLCPSATVSAADRGDVTYIQRVFNADNGLLCGHANDIVQTNDGILWVGSYSGLYRYNGSSFRFMEEFDNVKNVNCLYVDEEGRLWIGTNDSGVVIAIGNEEVNVLNTTKGLPSDSVRSIVQSSDGDYYIGTSDQMVVVRLKNGITISAELPGIRYAQSIAADRQGNVATVTSDGSLYVLKDGKVSCEVPKFDENVLYSCCQFSPEGLLFAGTTDGRVMVFKIMVNSVMMQHTQVCSGVSEINEIYFKDDNIWVLADNGIGRLHGNAYTKVPTGDFNSSVERMCVDYQGNLWFASTRHGLLQLSESCFSDLYTLYGISSAVVNTTAIHDGILFIGADNGLTEVYLNSGSLRRTVMTDTLKGVRIRCILPDSEGNVWFCTYGKGLICEKPDGEVVFYNSDRYGLGNRARGCIELSDGSIAVSIDSGLSIIKNGEVKTTIPYGGELGSSQILSLCEYSDGKLYLGTDGNGIIVYENGEITGHITKADGLGSEVILKMVYDSEYDVMFIVTSNSLCYLKKSVITPMKGFPYSNNYDIVLDKDGEAFVIGSAGIYVVRKAALIDGEDIEYTLLNSRLGLRGAITANSWNVVTGDKDLYLSTDRGVIKVNLDNYRSNRRAYRIMVSQVILDGVPADVERGNRLTIDKDVNTIEFIPEIVNFSFEDPKVSYYLEGVDTGYKTVSQSELTNVIYTNLPSGEYTFHIAILDEETGRILEESSYGFVKENSIYDNNWFMFYMLFVGGLFVGWATWFYTRYWAQKKMSMQQQRLALALKQVEMGNETIMAIARTVDAKDSMTSKHSQRVSEYSVLIAKKYGFSEEEVDNIRNAALLHDIGKIGIPDAILNKPDKLTDEEYARMKLHATLGADILKDFTLIEHAAEGAKYHHERYDGSGYPEGLKGDDIPLYGRIIALADAFDAMTANRVYRKRLSFERVMSELENGRGTQFDPELLDLFLELLNEGDIDVETLYAGVEDLNA